MRLGPSTIVVRAWKPLNYSRFKNVRRILENNIRHHVHRLTPLRQLHLHSFHSHTGLSAATHSSQKLTPSSSFKAFAAMAADEGKPESHHGHGKRPATPHQKSGLGKKRQQKKARKRERDMTTGSSEEVLAVDIRHLQESFDESDRERGKDVPLPEPGSEIIVKVLELSSTGEALAIQEGSDSRQVYVLPFAVPGDSVKVKVHRHHHLQPNPEDEPLVYSAADFISVVTPAPTRDDSRVRCPYFAKCSGCQFQMLDYAEQLSLKRRVVEKAFRNFSDLPPELIPTIGDTIGSPLQYGYRTKLTPHFDGPPGAKRRNPTPFIERPEIGFMLKGRRTTIDIEDCPIGTDAVRAGMKSERDRMAVEFGKYKRGSTILLRESTKRVPKGGSSSDVASSKDSNTIPSTAIKVETDSYVDYKTCITDNNATSTEYIGDYVFHNPAGSFFQNNNSILPIFTDYIRQHALPSDNNTDQDDITSSSSAKKIKYLIDAYSGSGLFTITLSSLFQGSTGIDIAEKSIEFASTNAAANSLPPSQANFIAADAARLFDSAPRYAPDETVVILDPPRKGCDASFLNQLLRFAPKRVVYVSCNVHTQARDVGMLVRGETGDKKAAEADRVETTLGEVKRTRYTVESICGFDFFPQTHHIEGVAVLNRVDD